MKITLFDADDLPALEAVVSSAIAKAFDPKALEDLFARALARGIVSALKIAQRDGLLGQPATQVADQSEDEPAEEPVRLPRFLQPSPDNPFPLGRAVEPPRKQKRKKTGSDYLRLYKTVGDRPEGFIDTEEATKILGGTPSHQAQIFQWLRTGQVEAVIVANVAPPTKGLPGRLMVNKASVRARDDLRRSNKMRSPVDRVSAPVVVNGA